MYAYKPKSTAGDYENPLHPAGLYDDGGNPYLKSQMDNLLVNMHNNHSILEVVSNCSYCNSSEPPGNVTYEPAPEFNHMSMMKFIVLIVMFVISFICNTATLVQMHRMRRRKSTINTLILHLATADLIVTFFCNVTDAVWGVTVQWYAGNGLCKIIKFLQVFGLYLSTYIIVIIAIDRCYAILDPMSRNKAPKRVRYMILAAWILSALFSCPQVCTDTSRNKGRNYLEASEAISLHILGFTSYFL